jgi:hypothetical protein
VTARRAKRENGVLGEDPPGRSKTDPLREPFGQKTSDSTSSEARKRGSGGGSPRKIEN